MKKTSMLSTVFAIVIVFAFGLACKSLSSLKPEDNSTKPTNTTGVANATNKQNSENSTSTNSAKTENPKLEKADFTMTSEQLDKEFTRKGVTDKDLEKYASKNIAVTGRVSLLSLEKKDTTQPWVTLFAPGLGHGVSCYFDDENVEQMKRLKMDKMVTVQGFQDDFIVTEISPMLKHCAVIEAN